MTNKSKGDFDATIGNTNVSTRFFFREGDAYCYTLKSHLQYMIETHIEEMPVWLAKRETGVSHFFCKHFQEIGEKSDSDCGRMCEAYKPRNGKNGVCKNYGYTYELTDKSYCLKVDSVSFLK